jgi:hypothetical protein
VEEIDAQIHEPELKESFKEHVASLTRDLTVEIEAGRQGDEAGNRSPGAFIKNRNSKE